MSSKPRSTRPPASANPPLTLSVDIGGTAIKASLLDPKGAMVAPRLRIETPHPSDPENLLNVLRGVAASLPDFGRISVGFPGVVRRGIVLTAPHLGTEIWRGFPLGLQLEDMLGKPARVLNDADVQGLGVITGHGLECILTFGTGVGSSFFLDGRLAPHIELSQHPIHMGKSYDDYLGLAALEAKGKKAWNRRVARAIETVRKLMNFDRLYLGGGNAARIEIVLPRDVEIVSNKAGITGGIHLWDPENDFLFAPAPALANAASRANAAE